IRKLRKRLSASSQANGHLKITGTMKACSRDAFGSSTATGKPDGTSLPGGAIMGRSWVGAVVVISSLCSLFASEALGHPASGIVVNANGEVFFIDTGHGVCKIDARGKLTYIHKVSGGGHFLALD